MYSITSIRSLKNVTKLHQSKIGKNKFVYPNRKEFVQLRREIFSEECYRPRIEKFDYIIDIGAYIGLSSVYFAISYPDSKVVAYEPNPLSQKYLIENTQDFKNIKLIDKAVTSKGGKVDFYLSSPDEQWFSNSSLNKNSWNGHIRSEKVEVDSIPLSKILKDVSGQILLKIDVEGYETGLVRDEIDLSNVYELFIEYHPQSVNRLRKMLKFLRSNNFQLAFEKDGSEINEIPEHGLCLIHAVRRSDDEIDDNEQR